ncbi:hypothetical protein ACJMK2_038869 [Sinanodonta woodiana]|uniref:CCHC-type domain-containing protein n=1 Tax=Sinanodonta woodiana TaxID=1069815 RepID=A0ABD3WDM3_SINWO
MKSNHEHTSNKILLEFTEKAPLLVQFDGYIQIIMDYKNQVRFCSKCKAWGHYTRNCKNKMRCGNCFGIHTDNCTCIELKCANCRGPHNPQDKECSYYIKEKETIKVMDEQHLSYHEAKQQTLTNRSKTNKNRHLIKTEPTQQPTQQNQGESKQTPERNPNPSHQTKNKADIERMITEAREEAKTQASEHPNNSPGKKSSPSCRNINTCIGSNRDSNLNNASNMEIHTSNTNNREKHILIDSNSLSNLPKHEIEYFLSITILKYVRDLIDGILLISYDDVIPSIPYFKLLTEVLEKQI